MGAMRREINLMYAVVTSGHSVAPNQRGIRSRAALRAWDDVQVSTRPYSGFLGAEGWSCSVDNNVRDVTNVGDKSSRRRARPPMHEGMRRGIAALVSRAFGRNALRIRRESLLSLLRGNVTPAQSAVGLLLPAMAV